VLQKWFRIVKVHKPISMKQKGLIFITVGGSMIPDSIITEVSVINRIIVSLELSFAED